MEEPYPNVSVVIRAHNEEKNITRCLESLLIQEHSFHTIIIDNASTDSTPELIEQFLHGNLQIDVEVVYESERGRGSALKSGVKRAKTDIVISLDGDSYTTQPDWLERLVSPLINDLDVVAASGRVKFYDGPFHHGLIYDAIRSSIYVISSYVCQGWLSLSNSAFRKSVFDEATVALDLNNGYPEDRVVALKLRPYGKIDYVHQALVYTHDWLLDNKTWGTHLIDEQDRIREIIGGSESQFHKAVRYVSFLCAQWDNIKQRFQFSP